MAKDYNRLAKDIIDNIGGEENVEGLRHCITRLRFHLKDASKANTDFLKKREGIVTVVESSGQYQVVIGNDVADVYDAIIEQTNIGAVSGGSGNNEDKSDISLLNRFIDLLSGLFQPFLAALAATGIIKGLVAILGAVGVPPENGVYQILNIVGDGFFQFLPVALAVTAAARFKLNQFVAIAIAAAFLHPAMGDLIAGEPLYTLFAGTAFESTVFNTFAGFPIILPPAGNYYSSVIPIIIAIWFASVVDKWVKKWMPKLISSTFTPVVTLLIATPISLLVIGPVATWASSAVGWVFTAINEFSPILFGGLLSGAWQVLVIFGLHWGIVPLGIIQLTTSGSSAILAQTQLSTFPIFGILLGIMIRSKEAKTKELAGSSALPALFGISEPAIYGLMLPMRKLFAVAIVINIAVGAVMGYFNTEMYNMGGLGIFSLPTFISPTDGITSNFWVTLLSFAIASILGFLAVMLMGVPQLEAGSGALEEEEEVTATEVKVMQDIIASPLKGEIVPLLEVEDQVFASGAMGKGLAVNPSEGLVVAPTNATVTTIFPTGHAIGLTTENGTEILIHIGLDTVEMDGEGFEALVQQGDSVVAGQELITFKPELIKERGFSTVTPIIVTNTNDFVDVLLTDDDSIDKGDYLLTSVKQLRS